MEETRRFSNGKIIGLMVACVLMIGSIFAGVLSVMDREEEQEQARKEQIIALNEIEKLTEQDEVSPAAKEIAKLQEELKKPSESSSDDHMRIVMLAGLLVVSVILIIFVYLWYTVIRPFQKLEEYAGEIAKGNLNIPLQYHRSNHFGAFTWAFDHMRREINKARSCEKEAIENNKTVIATLSHDIKTPIASIRAYAEGLEANMDTTLERKQRYLSVIMKKCDEVTALTNDLFLHSLSDLDKLQITLKEENLKELLEEAVEELNGDRGDIKCLGQIQPAWISCDRRRVVQVIENIVNNARKYASKPGITVWTEALQGENVTYKIHIKDSGVGILPEDMPFIFEKFYRGKNVSDEPGAGLGLYIVKYVMEQMKGEVRLYNCQDGLEVVLVFRSC